MMVTLLARLLLGLALVRGVVAPPMDVAELLGRVLAVPLERATGGRAVGGGGSATTTAGGEAAARATRRAEELHTLARLLVLGDALHSEAANVAAVAGTVPTDEDAMRRHRPLVLHLLLAGTQGEAHPRIHLGRKSSSVEPVS